MNQELQGALAKILTAMQQGLAEHGPNALGLALEVQRWDGIGRIATGLVLLAFTIWGAPRAIKVFWKEMAAFEKEAGEHDEPVIPMAWAVGSIVVLVPAGVAAVSLLTNIWNWIGIFRPEIAFAYNLMQRALQ